MNPNLPQPYYWLPLQSTQTPQPQHQYTQPAQSPPQGPVSYQLVHSTSMPHIQPQAVQSPLMPPVHMALPSQQLQQPQLYVPVQYSTLQQAANTLAQQQQQAQTHYRTVSDVAVSIDTGGVQQSRLRTDSNVSDSSTQPLTLPTSTSTNVTPQMKQQHKHKREPSDLELPASHKRTRSSSSVPGLSTVSSTVQSTQQSTEPHLDALVYAYARMLYLEDTEMLNHAANQYKITDKPVLQRQLAQAWMIDAPNAGYKLHYIIQSRTIIQSCYQVLNQAKQSIVDMQQEQQLLQQQQQQLLQQLQQQQRQHQLQLPTPPISSSVPPDIPKTPPTKPLHIDTSTNTTQEIKFDSQTNQPEQHTVSTQMTPLHRRRSYSSDEISMNLGSKLNTPTFTMRSASASPTKFDWIRTPTPIGALFTPTGTNNQRLPFSKHSSQ